MLDPLATFSVSTASALSTTPKVVKPTRHLLQPSPTHPDDYILELDYSSISEFLRCARAGENKLVHSREGSRDTTATSFGRLFHKCEELRLRHGLSADIVSRQRELISLHFQSEPVGPLEYRNAPRMIEVLDKYNSLYASDGWPENIITHEGEKFIERPFKIELCSIPVEGTLAYSPDKLTTTPGIKYWVTGEEPNKPRTKVRNLHILLTGRIDAILSNSNLLWVVDHKTSSRGGAEQIDAFHLSLQTRGYAWAATKLGVPVAGLLMNSVVVKPYPKTEKAKTPPTEFSRHPYFYSSDSLAEYEDNIRAHVSDFVANLVRGYFPQNSRSFISPCNRCEYSENCRLPRSQRAADLATDLYRDVTWSPIHEE